MNDDKALDDVDRREFAKTLLTAALENIEPMPAEIKRRRDGSTYLLITVQNSGGNAKIEYDPLPAIESLIEVVLLRGDLLPVREVLSEEVCADLQVSSPGQWLTDFLVDLVMETIIYLFAIVEPEFSDVTKQLPVLAMSHVQAVFAELMAVHPAGEAIKGTIPSREKLKDVTLRYANTGRRARLNDSMVAAKQAVRARMFDLNAFAPTYLRLKPEVDDAKLIFKRNRSDLHWRDYVIIAHPTMPEDLVERLASEDGYTAEPARIALRWAARECGAERDQFSDDQLFSRLSESKGLQQSSTPNPGK